LSEFSASIEQVNIRDYLLDTNDSTELAAFSLQGGGLMFVVAIREIDEWH
jgi:hypothetical protein